MDAPAQCWRGGPLSTWRPMRTRTAFQGRPTGTESPDWRREIRQAGACPGGSAAEAGAVALTEDRRGGTLPECRFPGRIPNPVAEDRGRAAERVLPDSARRVLRLSPPERPRLGFVGLGWVGLNRLEAVARSGFADVCAVSDPLPEAVGRALAVAPRAVRAPDLEGMLSLGLDGVVIATPSALHAQQSLEALAAGVAVFCQKPLARTAAETRAVVAAARQSNRLLGCDLTYRRTAGMQAIQRLIREGALGRVHAAHLVFHLAHGPDKAWFHDRRLSGGGCLIDLGTHLVDLALWCLGFPRAQRVCGALLRQGVPLENRDRGIEDYAAAQVVFDDGAVMQLTCSWKAHAGRDAVIEAGFYGTEGGAMFRNVDGALHTFATEQFLPGRERRMLVASESYWGGRAIVEWARRLSISGEYNPEIEAVSRVADVLDAIYARAS